MRNYVFCYAELNRMNSPKYLKQNDTVAIVSTARKISLEEIKPAIELLESWDLKVKIGRTIGLENNQFAGTDEIRKNDFQTMLDDDEVDAIWCARGGYGTVRIIDDLVFSDFKKNPKWVIGYSDVTVLHNHINNLGVETGATGYTGYTRFSFYNAKTGKVVVFFNKDNDNLPDEPANPEKMFFKTTLDFVNKEWNILTPSFSYNNNYPIAYARQLTTSPAYVLKVNDTFNNFENLRPLYPDGNTFDPITGTYYID